MQFERLRLSGFKSFVDPVEFRIEPGLTGVVGPNGCGKSNLLEGLRWVMGAASAKAMRGAGMDDVIFAGASGRPARGWAEVVLTIDNRDRLAPQPFTDAPVIEVSRRIDRGAGSTYRVNGKEVRARDVQLLFADASTGANSPALVRQGQISELIAAKPQNRRRILEEAAGVSGLHTRRHEAELRLRAADANLARLEDISREIDTVLNRLKREARLAEKYKKLSAEIRGLQSAVLYARWADARDARDRARAELADAAGAAQAATIAASAAETAALQAAEAVKPLREEDAVAAAVLHRLTLERDRLDLEARQAGADADRAKADIERIAADLHRETSAAEDSAGQLARLTDELALARADVTDAPAREPELEAAWRAADSARASADQAVERLAGQLAAEQARAAATAARLNDAQVRLSRVEQTLAAARADRARLGSLDAPEIEVARGRLTEAVSALQALRAALETAETARTDALAAEAAARQAARQHEDRLGRLQTEARGLAQLLTVARRDFPPVLDSVRPERGYEAALAAALGEDLDAALDPRAAAFWAGADAGAAAWPAGVEPLSAHVAAPTALAARLAQVGVVEAADGDRLRVGLPVGARLVSKAGDLWRWDGFVARAGAPKPAAVRLAQRTRLDEVEAEIDRLRPAAEAALADQKAAVERVRLAEATLAQARGRPRDAERAVGQARERVEHLTREQAQKEARAQALDETVARLEGEVAEARRGVAAAQPEGGPVELDALRADLASARETASAARAEAARARAAFDAEGREREGRQRRLAALERDHADWTRRAAAAAQRLTALESDRLAALAAREAAVAQRDGFGARRESLLDHFQAAEARRKTSADALAEAEAQVQAAERAGRAAEMVAGAAREARAGAEARAEATQVRLVEVETQVRETAQITPEELGRKLREEAIAQPADAAGAESLLYGLERERESLGNVNLRAEEEVNEHQARLATLRSERADLVTAIAKLRDGIDELNAEGRERLLAAFDVINSGFQALFQALFEGGQAELKLVESDDPLEAGLEIYACPPGKRLSTMSLMSGGEQALTAAALIFGVFLANPAPICVLDEVDAPLDDANVDRFCRMLNEMRQRTETRFVLITHNPVTMSRVDRLFGVTMPERGVSQLVSVDLTTAAAMAAE